MAGDDADRSVWSPDPVLSVVLITRNGARTIEGQLDAVLAQQWNRPWELVVVDNESTDSTPSIVRRWMSDHDRLRMVRATGVTNVAAARNAGVAAARGRYVTVVDDDDEVGTSWLRSIGEAVMEHDYVVARIDVTRLNDDVVRQARRTPIQTAQVDTWYGIPVGTGPTIAIRRDWYLGVGGNDEQLSAGEDIEFCLRVHDKYGVAPHFVNDAVYHYRLKSTFRSSFAQGAHYGRSDPEIYRRHRDELTESPRAVDALREWCRLIAALPLLPMDRARRLRWGYRAGIRYGRIVGSVKRRTIFL